MIKNKEQEKKDVEKSKKQALKFKKINDEYEKDKIWERVDHKTIRLVK